MGNRITVFIFSLFFANIAIMAQNNEGIKKPLRVGIVGLVHDHVRWVLGREKMGDYDLSSPANNEIVVKILGAATYSAKTGKTVVWKEFYKND